MIDFETYLTLKLILAVVGTVIVFPLAMWWLNRRAAARAEARAAWAAARAAARDKAWDEAWDKAWDEAWAAAWAAWAAARAAQEQELMRVCSSTETKSKGQS